MTCIGSFVAAIVSLGYSSLVAQALRDAFTCKDFSFRDYKQRIIFSLTGFALTARTTITHILCNLRSNTLQHRFWWYMGWLVKPAAWLSVINWAGQYKK